MNIEIRCWITKQLKVLIRSLCSVNTFCEVASLHVTKQEQQKNSKLDIKMAPVKIIFSVWHNNNIIIFEFSFVNISFRYHVNLNYLQGILQYFT